MPGSKILSVRLTDEIKEIIERLAAEGEPKSKIVRALIARGAAAEEIEPLLREILERIHSIELAVKDLKGDE